MLITHFSKMLAQVHHMWCLPVHDACKSMLPHSFATTTTLCLTFRTPVAQSHWGKPPGLLPPWLPRAP